MKVKKFGNIAVPAIGQGTGGDDVCDESHRIRVLQCGIDLGMTLIDTAETYRKGHADEAVGKAVRGKRDKVFIATKFSPEHNHYEGVIGALEGSLRRLNTDYVDLYQVHWPNPSVPIENTMRAMMDLKDSGKVLHIGVSNFSLRQLIQAQSACSAKIESNQVEYNLLERSIENDLLPYSSQEGIMTIAYNPLLRGKKGAEVLSIIARKYEKHPVQVILNWLISHGTVVAIPRTLSLEHTRENAVAADYELEPRDIAEIDRTFKHGVIEVPTSRIRVLSSNHEPVYVTLREALENRFNLTPSPQELARDILENNILKPVRLRLSIDPNGRYDYDLIQGRVRYWAWIIAHGTDIPIPAYLHE